VSSLGRLAALLLGWALASPLLAEGAVRAQLDARRIGVEDQVQLTITLEGSEAAAAQNVPVPQLENLRVVGGPSVSTQISFVNGEMSQSKTLTYVLQPEAAGPASVGPVRLALASGEQRTEPISIEVVAGSVRPKAQGRSRSGEPWDPFGDVFGRRSRAPQAQPKLFIEARASRTRLYVGEPLLVSYELYTQTAVSDVQLVDAPQYPGFWSEPLERSEPTPRGEVVERDGERYRRFTVMEKLLYPTKAGELTIPEATFRLGIPRQSFFDGGSQVGRSTQPLVITAQALPDVPGFSGAVGQFQVSAALDRESVPLGEAVTLRFQVKGKGNLNWVDEPPELTLEGLKLYPPQVKSDLRVGKGGIAGAKTWEFVVVPETAGATEIPGIDFAYFDPERGRIVHAVTRALPLSVEGAATASGAAPLAPPALGIARGGALPLRTELELSTRAVPALRGGAVASGLVLILLLHAGIWGGAQLSDWRRRAAGRAAPRPSVRKALNDLSRAGRDKMSKEASAALIEKTLHDLFGALGTDGAQPADERERAARAVLREVEFIRYAPQLGDYSEKIREIAARAADVVRKWA